MRGVTAMGTLILARVLTPADFGVYAVLALVSTVLASVSDFGIAASLVQQRDEPTGRELSTAWILQQLAWIPFVAGIWFVSILAPAVLGQQDDAFLWQVRIVSLSIALTMLRSLPSAMLVRELRFGAIAAIEVSMHVCFYVVAVAMALRGAGVWSFVVAIVAQTATGAVLANVAWPHWPGARLDKRIAARQVRFGAPFQIGNVVTLGNDAVVPVFGGWAGGLSAVGYMQFSLRISQLAASIDEIVSRVAFPAFSRLQHDRAEAAATLRDVIAIVGFVTACVQIWIVSVASGLVPFLFGPQWLPAAPALQLFCLSSLAVVPARVTRSFVLGQGRSGRALSVNLAGSVVLWVVFPVLVLVAGVSGAGLAYLIAGVASLWLFGRAAELGSRFPWRALTGGYAVAAAAGSTSFATISLVGGIPGLIASLLVYGGSLACLVYLLRPSALLSAWERFASTRASSRRIAAQGTPLAR